MDLLSIPLVRPIDFTEAGRALRRLRARRNVSALYFVAHPDDEDAATLTFLARALGVRTAIWSATCGEGGQNLVGSEAGAALGARRAAELVSAARWYGVDDVDFGGFADFGYTTSLAETEARWGADALVDAMVATFERHRPTIALSRFTGAPSDGHGHHQAVGRAVQEAFALYGACEALFVSDPGGDTAFDVGRALPGYGASAAALGAYGMAEHRTQHGGVLTEPSPGCVRRYRGTRRDPFDDLDAPARDPVATNVAAARRADLAAFERGLSLEATATEDGDAPLLRFYDPIRTFAGPRDGAPFVVDVRSEGPRHTLALEGPWPAERIGPARWRVTPEGPGAVRVVARLEDGLEVARPVERRTPEPPHTRVAIARRV